MNDSLKARLDAIKAWQDQINSEAKRKATGEAVLRPGDRINAPRLASGAPSLDIRLGGGWPRGAITEIYGPNGSGKSTLAYQTIATLLRREPNSSVLLVDVENSYSGKRGAAMGISLDDPRMVIYRPRFAEQAFDRIRDVLRETYENKPMFDLIVLDSVAALVPEAEDEASAGDSQVGILARYMSRYLRQFGASLARTGATLICINQIRMKIGVMYGNPETTPGGEALAFFAWSRVRTSKVRDIKKGEDVIGQETKATIKKAKLDDSVGGEATFLIYRRNGIDAAYDIWRLGVPLGLINKQGNTLSVTTPFGEIRGGGKEAFLEALRNNEAALDFCYQELVKTALRDNKTAALIDAVEEADRNEGDNENFDFEA